MKYLGGTAEQIRAKFTTKTCLVPHSDEFACERSRSPQTKNGTFGPIGSMHVVYVW